MSVSIVTALLQHAQSQPSTGYCDQHQPQPQTQAQPQDNDHSDDGNGGNGSGDGDDNNNANNNNDGVTSTNPSPNPRPSPKAAEEGGQDRLDVPYVCVLGAMQVGLMDQNPPHDSQNYLP